MYGNLKEEDTNLKGEIGELIAKYNLKGAILTRHFHYNILKKFNLKPEQLNFLIENWKSFDLIDPASLIIYEVKTKNFFFGNLKGVQNKTIVSLNFIKLCQEAISLGFSIKSVTITLFSNWKYGLVIKEFNEKDFWVHQNKPSGWKRWLEKKK